MTKNQGYAALTTLCMLATATAHADTLFVNFTSQDPTYSGQFGGLSFIVDTAATVDTLSTGACGAGTTTGVYEYSQFNGGVTNAALVWDGVTYTLQSSVIYLEQNSESCGFYLNLNLTFNNGTTFSTQDQPSGGPYVYANYNPSQLLSAALTAGYNNQSMNAAHLTVAGQSPGLDNFIATVTAVP